MGFDGQGKLKLPPVHTIADRARRKRFSASCQSQASELRPDSSGQTWPALKVIEVDVMQLPRTVAPLMYAHLIKPRGHFSVCEHVPAAAAGAEPLQIPRHAALISVHSKAAAMAALIDSLVPPKERSAKPRSLNSTAHLPPIHVTCRKARDYSEQFAVRSRYSSAPAHSAADPDAMPHGGYIAAATLLARMHRRTVDADPVAVDSRTELCDELWKHALIEKESLGLLTMKQMDALLAHFNAVRDGTAVLKNLSMHAFSHLPWRPSDVVTDLARERAFLTLSTDGLFDVRAFVRMVTMQTVGPRAQRRKYLFDCLDAANRRVVDLPALHHFLVSIPRKPGSALFDG